MQKYDISVTKKFVGISVVLGLKYLKNVVGNF